MAAEAGSFTGGTAAAEPRRPSSVSWELGAGPVPCSDRRRVSLEPAVQSRTEMLQKSVLKNTLCRVILAGSIRRRGGPGHLLEQTCLQSSGGIGALGKAGARGRTA
jgi:hypothetical protein